LKPTLSAKKVFYRKRLEEAAEDQGFIERTQKAQAEFINIDAELDSTW